MKWSAFSFFLLIALSTYLMPHHVMAQQYVQPQYVQQQPQGQFYAQPYYGTQSEYYYNQNNPWVPSGTQYGFYGGFYGSPPPPTPSQSFPDKAAADNLYRYIQSR